MPRVLTALRGAVLAATALSIAACGGAGGDDAPDLPLQAVLVGEVQGSGDASPLEGRIVTVEGVVSGDYQDGDDNRSSNLGGFFVMGEPDDDAQTSDGLFIFEGGDYKVDVAVGDVVRIAGRVEEFFGETQIHADRVDVIGEGPVVAVSLPVATRTRLNSDGQAVADLERFEGMLVRSGRPLTVNDTFGLERYGYVMLADGGRVTSFTNNNRPSVMGYRQHLDALALRSLVLDDGRRDENPKPVRYLDPDAAVRVGDRVDDVVGVLRYSRGSGGSGFETYRLMPTENPVFVRANPRPDIPERVGSLRVAGLNMLNLFTTIDRGEPACGPARDSGCRGADSERELTRQLGKSVAALKAINADVVGLMEIENNDRASLEAIVNALGSAGIDYDYVDTGTIGSDAIKVGFLYKPETVSPIGDFAILDSSVDERFIDSKNRPVLAQTFEQSENGEGLTVAVNHLKSKGSDCDELGDPDLGDGQGDCNQTRTAAATAMASWLRGDPTGSGETDVLVIGDLNAYTMEDPLQALKDAGFTNLIETRDGRDSYSFVFRGQSGALDHALASPTLVPKVRNAFDWHINADESRLIDYNLEWDRDPALFDASSPFRSSDHDPLIVDLELSNR